MVFLGWRARNVFFENFLILQNRSTPWSTVALMLRYIDVPIVASGQNKTFAPQLF